MSSVYCRSTHFNQYRPDGAPCGILFLALLPRAARCIPLLDFDRDLLLNLQNNIIRPLSYYFDRQGYLTFAESSLSVVVVKVEAVALVINSNYHMYFMYVSMEVNNGAWSRHRGGVEGGSNRCLLSVGVPHPT